MKGLRKFFSNININDFRRYTIFSILLIITILVVGAFNMSLARYETNTAVNVSPTLAFFVVDVRSQTGQIELASMVPSSTPYLYSFTVSNYDSNLNKKANVDLTYSIEIITTTNMPLNFKIFKGENLTQDEIDSDTISTDSNGVYYRHLVINDVSTFRYNTVSTDTYTLWVEFPLSYRDYPDDYSGIIDLVDIKINAEQVV